MSDRTNTIFGWILFAGVVALLLRFATGMVIPEDHRPDVMGYVIEGVESGEEDAGPTLAQLLAGGSAADGEGSFAKCIACHTIEQGGAEGIGPNLFGMVGQPIAASGFDYSGALSDVGGDWTFEQMDAWLRSPRNFANGTKMSFAGLSDEQERANVILYLLENGGGPALPEVVVVEEAADAGEEAEAEAEENAGEEIAAATEG